MKRLALTPALPFDGKKVTISFIAVQIVPNNTISKAPLNPGLFMEKKKNMFERGKSL